VQAKQYNTEFGMVNSTWNLFSLILQHC